MKTKHCLYIGLKVEGKYLCKIPGMEFVKCYCTGYDKCDDYKESSREIKEKNND
ncbi:MAG TPA: hypothetical protein VMZ91_11765 [Candidatus Paceibacterota bacterium]|nr:hypothetical protein [Candidatus Paceibacterota bacterium]